MLDFIYYWRQAILPPLLLAVILMIVGLPPANILGGVLGAHIIGVLVTLGSAYIEDNKSPLVWSLPSYAFAWLVMHTRHRKLLRTGTMVTLAVWRSRLPKHIRLLDAMFWLNVTVIAMTVGQILILRYRGL